MTEALSNEQGVDFDRDLARLEQIRGAHKSARPTHENPAWLNTHGDLGFALGFIDDLWRTYTNEMRKLDKLNAQNKELARLLRYAAMHSSLALHMNDAWRDDALTALKHLPNV